MWAAWESEAPADKMANIKYYFSIDVSNPDSETIIRLALKTKGQELSAWPGTSFDMDTDAGRALLGMQNRLYSY